MIRCLAIDDEPLALQQLATYIQKIPFFEFVGNCQSAVEAKKKLDEEDVDAIFIDINMPDLNGLDFVRSLIVPPLIVFTTAYSEFALEGYKVSAVDYLLKPFSLDDFKRTALKVKERFELINRSNIANNHEVESETDEDGNIFIKVNGRVIRLDINTIRYVESMSEYVKIYVDGASQSLIVLISMKKMEDRLCSYSNFMRIHRSYIVNLKKIQEVNKNRVIMDAQTYLPIGDLYREALEKYINTKFLGR